MPRARAKQLRAGSAHSIHINVNCNPLTGKNSSNRFSMSNLCNLLFSEILQTEIVTSFVPKKKNYNDCLYPWSNHPWSMKCYQSLWSSYTENSSKWIDKL